MEPLIMAGLGFLILLPILYMLPLGMDIKGKLMLAGAALLLSLLWIAAQPLIESWKIILIILLLSALGVYFLDKKLGHWFSRPLQEQEEVEEEVVANAETVKEEGLEINVTEVELHRTQSDLVKHQAKIINSNEDQQAYIEEELQLLTEQEDNELDELPVITDMKVAEHVHFDEEETVTVQSNDDKDEHRADDSDSFEIEELSVIEFSEGMSSENDQDSVLQLDDEESELLQRDFDAFIPSEDETNVYDDRLTHESGATVEAELIDRDLGSLADVDEDSDALTPVEKASGFESHKALWELEDLEEMLLEIRAENEMNASHHHEAIVESVNAEDMDDDVEAEISITEKTVELLDEQIPIGHDIGALMETIDGSMQEESLVDDRSVTEMDEEVALHLPDPSTFIRKELFSLMLEEVRMMGTTLPPVGYEALIRQYMDANLPDEEHFTFARLLMDHFIMQKEYDKLADCLMELEPRYKRYPVLAAEIDLLKTVAMDQ